MTTTKNDEWWSALDEELLNTLNYTLLGMTVEVTILSIGNGSVGYQTSSAYAIYEVARTTYFIDWGYSGL